MSNATLAMIGVVIGGVLFGAGFLVSDLLIWAGGLLLTVSVLFPFVAPYRS